MSSAKSSNSTRYSALIEKVFFDRYRPGSQEVAFERTALETTARRLGIELPKNLGDIIYSFRYRTSLPPRIVATQPPGLEWVIESVGRAQYIFRLKKPNPIVPNELLVTVKVPDATPELIGAYALSDEQALLAKVRYNRLIDIFLGIACYSLQNHLRTTVAGIGQIEVDEIYVGLDTYGSQYVVPVQAKGGSDRLSQVQTSQDIACCAEKFPALQCRAVSTQFMADDLIALFELTIEEGEIKLVAERHYRLVPSDQISSDDLRSYAARRVSRDRS